MKLFSVSPRRSARSLPSLAAAFSAALLTAGPAGPCVVASAQGAELPLRDPGDEPEPPFFGEVALDRVEVRSGAGESYYPVAVFERGQRVKVVEDFYGWYRIEAPEGLRAYVAQRDLDRRGNGSVGEANADAARVKIKGLDRGYDDSFRTITFLNPGDRVQIVGTVGDEAYEVLAPEGSLVFLPPGSLTPLARAADPPAQATPPATRPIPPAPEPAPADTGAMVPLAEALAGETPDTPEAEAPEVPETAETPDAPETLPPIVLGDGGAEAPGAAALDAPEPAPAATATPASDAVAAVEAEQLPRFSLPLEEQPLDEMQAAYEGLRGGGELRPFEERLVTSRLRAVQRNRQLMAAIAQIQQRKDGLVEVQPTAIEPEPAEPYAAVGVLRTSSVFAGEEAGVALPKMYRVVDPATERTIAYLRPAAGIDPVPLLGRLVGVRGSREIDATLNTPLVVAQEVVGLDAAQ